MTTVLDLISDAMLDIGAIAIGEAPTASESNTILRALNQMVETWNNESLMIYNVVPELFNYVGGQASYTMGVGGNFNTARPVKIEAAYNHGQNGTPSQVDFPIEVTTNFERYSEIVTKQVSTQLPIIVYDNGDYPLKTLFFWPIPVDNTYQPQLWSWSAITSFASTSTVISLPPGYTRALQKNLSLEISPSFGKAIPQSLAMQAMESKAQLKRINFTLDELDMPRGIPRTVGNYGLPQFLSGR